MIEANYPEINLDELMEKIREEVAKRNGHSQPTAITSKAGIADTSEPATMMLILNHIDALLRNAESRANIRTKWPDKLNRFPFNLTKPIQKLALKVLNFIFKDQREVNFNLLQSLKESVALNRQLIEQIITLKTQMDQRLGAVDSRLQGLDKCLGAVDNNVEEISDRLGAVDNNVQEISDRLGAVDITVQGMDGNLNTIDNWINTCMTGIQENLNAVNNRVQGIDQHLGTVNSQVQGIDQHLGTVDTRIQGLDRHIGTVDTRIQGIDERYIRNDSYLKNDLMQQKRLIAMFLEEAKRRLPEPFNQQQLQTFANEEQHALDAFYVAFEDKFRGSREDIHNRLKVYLPLIEEAKMGTPDSPILDVGCGRGEWLELLRESGYTARGIDINKVMLDQCQSRDLEVIEADVIAYLQSLPDASLGAVTGFHIIEHLPFAALIKLFDEAVRVLKPAGLVIFETPNPDNVLVGSNTFYLDPTHRNPLPSSMIQFVAESRGLSQVTTKKLHPYAENFILSGSDVAERFNEYFYGAQDYAVIGYKNG